MKAISIITGLLMCQIMFLKYALREDGWSRHRRLDKMSRIDLQALAGTEHWSQMAISSCFGLMLLSLALIIAIWRNPSSSRPFVYGLGIIWVIMFISSFAGVLS